MEEECMEFGNTVVATKWIIYEALEGRNFQELCIGFSCWCPKFLN